MLSFGKKNSHILSLKFSNKSYRTEDQVEVYPVNHPRKCTSKLNFYQSKPASLYPAPEPPVPTPLRRSKPFTALYNYLRRDSMVLPHLHLRRRRPEWQNTRTSACTRVAVYTYRISPCARTRESRARLKLSIMRGRAALGPGGANMKIVW